MAQSQATAPTLSVSRVFADVNLKRSPDYCMFSPTKDVITHHFVLTHNQPFSPHLGPLRSTTKTNLNTIP